jgi:ubiquinone/menaquinone biosynthesis C-methylase UbiE
MKMTVNPPKFLLDIYFQLKPHSTKAWEKYWSGREVGNDWKPNEQDGWIDGYYKSTEHPHRKLLADKILSHNPKSILEVGCNCAPNLFLLKKYTNILMTGVDINLHAIRIGEFHRAMENIDNLDLWCCRAEQIKNMGMRWDLVFTDAMMIYIDPEKIDIVMNAIKKVAKKSVIFLERHIDGVGWQGIYNNGLWKRDYIELAYRYWPSAKVEITKIEQDVWVEWSEHGYIIEVSF